MSSILDLLSGRLNDDALRQMSGALGADQGATSKALAAAVPLLVGALARNAANPDGAQQLHDAVTRDHDGSALDQPPPAPSPGGDAILGHILGDRQATAERGIASVSGLDTAKVGPLLSMLAPLVMGALGKAQRQGGLGPSDLSAMLGREGQALGGASGVMGMVTKLFDRDHDGSIVDDLGGMLGGLLRR